MDFVFTGKTQTRFLWNNAVIPAGNGDAPFTTTTGQGDTKPYSPDAMPITFDKPSNGSIPADFTNISINGLKSLFSDTPIQLSYSRKLNFIISGVQNIQEMGQNFTNIQVWEGDQGFPSNPLGNSDNGVTPLITQGSPPQTSVYCTSITYTRSACPGWIYEFPAENFIVNFVQVVPWSRCTTIVGCSNQLVSSFVLSVEMEVTVNIRCSTDSDLESGFCLNYCLEPDNQTICYPKYEQYCLVETGSDGNINLFTSDGCNTFFKDYLSNQGPRAEVDNYISGACSQFSVDEFDAQDSTIRNICACHLRQDIYDNLRDSLIGEFPGFQYVDENERCLFPPCPSSEYKTVSIGKTCVLPKCINLASVTNNGTIKGGTKIIQSEQGCVDASNQTGNNAGEPVEEVKSWLEKHWVWLVLGISILVVLIIVILIILASEGNKKKPQIQNLK